MGGRRRFGWEKRGRVAWADEHVILVALGVNPSIKASGSAAFGPLATLGHLAQHLPALERWPIVREGLMVSIRLREHS